jgi:2-iminoacetate synthase
MSYYHQFEKLKDINFNEFFNSLTSDRISSILARDHLSELDYLALLSPAAAPMLEQMAQKAQVLTRRHFGNVVFIFTPMYISNHCENACPYCSFARQQHIGRRHLSLDDIKTEAALIRASGIRHVLVLTGEARRTATPEYIAGAVKVLRDYFSSIALEVYPMTGDEYGMLVESGVDGLTLYQETYDEACYHTLHQGGPKDNYTFRLDAPERACRAGVRSVTVGALLGLHDPVRDVFFAGTHAGWLQQAFPSVEVSIAFPRMRPLVAEFRQQTEVSDRAYVQYILATRLFLPTAGITLSTREPAAFRNACVSLGVTRMSAGVSTAVGGHTGDSGTPQFEISDVRSVEEVKSDLLRLGFQPVMHDWNRGYVNSTPDGCFRGSVMKQ